MYAGGLMSQMQRGFSDLVCQPLVTSYVIDAYLCFRRGTGTAPLGPLAPLATALVGGNKKWVALQNRSWLPSSA